MYGASTHRLHNSFLGTCEYFSMAPTMKADALTNLADMPRFHQFSGILCSDKLLSYKIANNFFAFDLHIERNTQTNTSTYFGPSLFICLFYNKSDRRTWIALPPSPPLSPPSTPLKSTIEINFKLQRGQPSRREEKSIYAKKKKKEKGQG